MYATCLQCDGALARNDLIESFPVGRRLAYDAAGGRLWVVCPTCGTWNLAPVEERWLAMEEAERAYRATRARVATGEIGLARLRDGRGAVDLVRIGRPLRPEFAAWRYGERFAARHRRYQMAVGLGLVGFAANVLGVATVIAFGLGSGFSLGASALQWHLQRKGRRARIALPGEKEPMTLKGEELQRVRLVPRGEGFALRFVCRPRPYASVYDRTVELEGDDAVRAARAVLPAINAHGGDRRNVADAVTLLEDALQGPRGALFGRLSEAPPLVRFEKRLSNAPGAERWLSYVPLEKRLALEMALNEEVERRALEGELALLALAWREAEALARITDSLAVPAEIEAKVARRD